tara:strand:+ start:753 stop:1547 length:795 start_codon:yes stop_codon:yes gene_type:complete
LVNATVLKTVKQPPDDPLAFFTEGSRDHPTSKLARAMEVRILPSPSVFSLCNPCNRGEQVRYTVYKTTNTVNGKIYIGVHQTKNPNDAYLGSGLLLRRALKKYGRAVFTKEVLHDFNTPEEMLVREREIVTTAFKRDPMTYNLVEGGLSAFTTMPRAEVKALSVKGNERFKQRLAEDPILRKANTKRLLDHLAQRENNPFAGWAHTEETKAKMRGPRPASTGRNNSQHGTVWVCREEETPRKIKKNELPGFIEAGWQRGRKVRP